MEEYIRGINRDKYSLSPFSISLISLLVLALIWSLFILYLMTFNPKGYCTSSDVPIEHSTIITRRCGHCGLLNPSHPSFHEAGPSRARSVPATREIITLDSPTSTPSSFIPPLDPRSSSLQVPGPFPVRLRRGIAAAGAQEVNQAIVKKGLGINSPPPTITFSIGLWRSDL